MRLWDGGGEVANVCGCREVMRYTECNVIYGRLWDDRWAVEWRFFRSRSGFFYFLKKMSTKWGEDIRPRSWNQAGCWDPETNSSR